MASVLTPAELRDLLATLLEGAAGETADHWRQTMRVTELPLATNVRSNWTVTPTGSMREREIIAKAAEVVRAEHPYVVGR